MLFALVPSGASSGSIYLVDDAGDSGGPFAGGFVLPGSGSASNSQCTVSASDSSVSTSGNNLTLTLSLSFTPSFAGNKVFSMAARDTGSGNSGWQALGTWNLPGFSPSGPWVSGMSPARSTSATQTYTFTFTDTQGWQDLAVLDILINSVIDGISACYVAYVQVTYVPSGATTGSLFLVDDTGDAGGPFAEEVVVPGAGPRRTASARSTARVHQWRLTETRSR